MKVRERGRERGKSWDSKTYWDRDRKRKKKKKHVRERETEADI